MDTTQQRKQEKISSSTKDGKYTQVTDQKAKKNAREGNTLL